MTKEQIDEILKNWDKMPDWVKDWTLDLIYDKAN